MSTFWTPEGERPIPRDPPPSSDRAPAGSASGGPGPQGEELSAEDEAALTELQQQLAQTPVELVIANHAFGLFELAALHLSLQPPQLRQARQAIDALGALVEGMAGRLGEYERQLIEGLANLRMAFVQIRAASQGDVPGAAGPASAYPGPPAR
jgi:Domain of unknown function (DUF1844)